MKSTTLFTAFAAAVFLAGCQQHVVKSYTVVYSVSGTAKTADVVYSTDAINKSDEHGVALPWSKTITAESETPIALAIQIPDSGGTVKGSVHVDGQDVKDCDSSGAGGMAECGAGMLP